MTVFPQTKEKADNAFEIWYAMGAAKTFQKVADTVGVSRQTIRQWADKTNWTRKMQERMKAVDGKVEQKAIQAAVRDKLRHRQEINDTLNVLRAVENVAVKKLNRGELEVTSVSDVAGIARAQAELVRLDLVLMGEADSRPEHIIKIEHVLPDGARVKQIESRTTNEGEPQTLPVADEGAVGEIQLPIRGGEQREELHDGSILDSGGILK